MHRTRHLDMADPMTAVGIDRRDVSGHHGGMLAGCYQSRMIVGASSPTRCDALPSNDDGQAR
jgi:hypothetical protein